MTKKHTKRPDRIKEIIETVLKKLEKKEHGVKGEVIKAWYAAIDSTALKHTRPVSIKKKILIVQVDSSAWLYTLNLKKAEILNKIKNIAGPAKICGLRFKIGELT